MRRWSPTTRCLACSPATRQLRRYCSQRSAAVYHHSQDFDWDELRKRSCRGSIFRIAAGWQYRPTGATQELLWESSYKTHAEQSSHLFKERRYLLQAFPSLSSGELQVLEVG